MSMLAYTGVGSHLTPAHVLRRMTALAHDLAAEGYTLRTSAAAGAGVAFEQGVRRSKGTMEIYLPYRGCCGHTTGIVTPSTQAAGIAKKIRDDWDRLPDIARRFHASFVHQVLGLDLQAPSLFVVCWKDETAPDAPVVRSIATGGTSTAMSVARMYRIPIFNLKEPNAIDDLDRVLRSFRDKRWNVDEPGRAESFGERCAA